jgi:hypothetical protein
VKSISRIQSGGSLDFGGSEFTPAERIVIDSKKIDPADKYGWWSLAAGDYVVEHNEELSLHADQVALILPHERLLEAGAAQSVRIVLPPGGTLMSIVHVCHAGVRIKENARISKLMIFQYG